METLRPLTPEQLELATSRLLNPLPGGKIAAAVAFGLDMSLLVIQLRLTPDQRARKLQILSLQLDQVRNRRKL